MSVRSCITSRLAWGGGVLSPLRPIPLALKEVLEKEVKTILKLGVIEESTSLWQSLPVVLPKPHGSVQFCIDFHKLNNVAMFDACLMHWVDALLDVMGRPKCCPQ